MSRHDLPVCFFSGMAGSNPKAHLEDVRPNPIGVWAHVSTVRSPTHLCATCRVADTHRGFTSHRHQAAMTDRTAAGTPSGSRVDV